ncbi:MAG: hypothetical protein ACREDZ_16725 [Kiloniellales bacterium]
MFAVFAALASLSLFSVTAFADQQSAVPVAGLAIGQPSGQVSLRVIPHIGGASVNQPIQWEVMTFGRDTQGQRQRVAEMVAAQPQFVLPAGWYVVHARVGGREIVHPIEVTAGRSFKYTLVQN